VSYSGFAAGEDSSVLGGTLAYGGSSQGAVNAGSYVITPSGLTSGNYTISYVNGSLTVNRAGLTVTALDVSKTYNGLAYSGGAGVSYSGFAGGEDSSVLGGTLSYGGSSQGAVNAGSYAITPSGLTSGNYTISYVNGNLTVRPATLTYVANPVRLNFGSPIPPLTGTVVGFVNGETQADATTGVLLFSTTGTNASPGNFPITGSGLTANHGNYVFVQDPANATALNVSEQLVPPPAAPIIVPAFPDNGIKAIANDTRPPEFGGMNYVAALFEGATPTSTAPTATGQTQGTAPTASAAPTQGGAMNYVSISSKVTDAGQELQVRLSEDKNRKPQIELNVNNTTVSSNTSPLDVFVVDTGINLSNLINGK